MGTLVSVLLWMGGQGMGLARDKLLAALLRLWAALVACVAGLLLVRSRVGDGLVDYDASQATVTARHIAGQDLLWLLLGLAWAIACLVVAASAAAVVTRRPPQADTPSDQTRE